MTRKPLPEPESYVYCERCHHMHGVLPKDFDLLEHTIHNSIVDMMESEDELWMKKFREGFA